MFVLVPLGSDQSVRRLPWFTIGVIAVCVVVQVHVSTLGTEELEDFFTHYAFHPAHPSLVDALASAFIHGGWLHLIGNMLFLWLIGCNLEDRWGHLPFAVLYLAGALAAVFAFSLAHPNSEQALIGASGAIAAGMGAFAITHHGANIRIGYLSWVMKLRAGSFWVPRMGRVPGVVRGPAPVRARGRRLHAGRLLGARRRLRVRPRGGGRAARHRHRASLPDPGGEQGPRVGRGSRVPRGERSCVSPAATPTRAD